MIISEMKMLEIISSAGQARNCYIQAIQEAKSKQYEECNELMRQGNEWYAKGHRIHHFIIEKEAGGEHIEVSAILAHAQDQLMSAESFKILCEEFIDLYRRMDTLDEQNNTTSI